MQCFTLASMKSIEAKRAVVSPHNTRNRYKTKALTSTQTVTTDSDDMDIIDTESIEDDYEAQYTNKQ